MTPTYGLIFTIIGATAIIVMLTINLQAVSAPRECPGCGQFKILTHEFEKSVIDAAVIDPNSIPGLLEQYDRQVLELFTGPE